MKFLSPMIFAGAVALAAIPALAAPHMPSFSFNTTVASVSTGSNTINGGKDNGISTGNGLAASGVVNFSSFGF